MDFIGIKELSQKTSRYISAKGPVVVTKNGHPVKLMMDIDGGDLEDYILAQHFDLESLADAAKREYRAGRTKSLRQLMRDK